MSKFRYLNKNEARVVNSFAEDTESPAPVLKLVYSLFAKFITANKKRSRDLFRLKLFELAGLICIIPVKEIWASVPALDVAIDSNVIDSLVDYQEGEYSVQAVMSSDQFKGFANLHVDGNETLGSLLLKKDKDGIACVRAVKFLPDLTALADDISATSELFTRTIFVSSCQDGVKRDKVSILYDLVQQADFLFHIQNEDEVIIKEIAKVRMNVRACIFALEVFDLLCEAGLESGALNLIEDKLSASSDKGRDLILYLEYIKNSLIDSVPSRIALECKVDSALADKIMTSIKSVKNFKALSLAGFAGFKTDA